MNRTRLLNRREALKKMGSCGIVPLFAQVGPGGIFAGSAQTHPHPRVPFPESGGPWEPLLLDAHQDETVTVLAERIIPETDTPGARSAKVNQQIDFVLSRDEESKRKAFLEGLAWLDRRSRERHGSAFKDLPVEHQNALLAQIAGDPQSPERERRGSDFFYDLKRRTIEAYYTSEAGIREELAYPGNLVLLEFPGCRHPEHHGWEP